MESLFCEKTKIEIKRINKDNLFFMSLMIYSYNIASLILVNFPSKSSNLSNCSIFAPSDFASLGLGWVSIKIPSAPTAIPALAMVSISSGRPPVTPLFWLGCCNEWVTS